ncbi:MAG: hypothetical protein AAGD11_20155 [Planctomycetota bacterium]
MNSATKLCLIAMLTATRPTSTHATESVDQTSPRSSVLNIAVARIIKDAIPREYEKRKDWGNTKQVTVGLRTDGLRINRRKKSVNHGVWKRYRVHLIDPDDQLAVQIENVGPSKDGSLAFTLRVQAHFDLWARAKVYQYGVHLIALEAVADATVDLQVDCEVGVRLQTQTGTPGVAIQPTVTNANLDIVDFQLRRVSNARGPIVRELGEELPRLLEDKLQGPKFVAKLNRAIKKKSDHLEIGVQALWR